MKSDNRVYVDKDFVIFEKTFDWEYILSIAKGEDISPNNLNIDSVCKSLINYLPENIDIDELFSEYLESCSEEK